MIRRRRLPEDPKSEPLNMTPMIDVVFQLLIFFMLSMHFKEVEGKLLSQLPDKGPGIEAVKNPELLEVRIVLCSGGDAEQHLRRKEVHEREAKTGDVCSALVEGNPVGTLERTETKPSALSANRTVYKALGQKAREVRNGLPRHEVHGAPPIIIDADAEVAYEHVVGTLNALKEVGIDRIEFAASVRQTDRLRR